MISGKLIETIFHRLWILAIPVILTPIAVLALTARSDSFESRSTVWVSSPIGDAQPSVGQSSAYLSPAQNQVQALNDLLSTELFRQTVARTAGIVSANDSPDTVAAVAVKMSISAAATGVNLLTVTARAAAPERAQAIASAVISRYQNRGTVEIQRAAASSGQYYTQQLAVAQQALDKRREDLTTYLRANPKAVDPTNAASLDLNYRTIVNQVDQQVKVVDGLVQSLQGVELRQVSAPQSQQASFSVQDPASRPTAPLSVASTKKYGLPFAGLLFGILISCVYVYFKFRTDHTIRTSADLVGINVPLLGTVPDLRPGGRVARYTPVGWYLTWRQRDFARRTAASIAGSSTANAGVSAR